MPMPTTVESPTANIGRRELSICVVGSESDPVQQTVSQLDKAGYAIEGTCSVQEALEKVRVGSCRVLLADVETPEMSGFALLDRALHFDPGIWVILVAQEYSVDAAIDAVKRGAHDFIRKPIDYARLSQTLDQLTERLATRSQVRELQDQLLSNLRFHGIIGKSPAMLEMFDMAQKVARHFTTVLITGPTGSGKELVARATSDEPSRAATLCGVQLLGDRGYPAGKPAFRPRARLVYGRLGYSRRVVRIRQRRDGFPG
jgi:DNA-binding NtrC family response regulator